MGARPAGKTPINTDAAKRNCKGASEPYAAERAALSPGGINVATL